MDHPLVVQFQTKSIGGAWATPSREALLVVPHLGWKWPLHNHLRPMLILLFQYCQLLLTSLVAPYKKQANDFIIEENESFTVSKQHLKMAVEDIPYYCVRYFERLLAKNSFKFYYPLETIFCRDEIAAVDTTFKEVCEEIISLLNFNPDTNLTWKCPGRLILLLRNFIDGCEFYLTLFSDSNAGFETVMFDDIRSRARLAAELKEKRDVVKKFI